MLLNVSTEIEAGNLAAELEKIERAVGGKSTTDTAVIHTQHITMCVCVSFLEGEKLRFLTPEELWEWRKARGDTERIASGQVLPLIKYYNTMMYLI